MRHVHPNPYEAPQGQGASHNKCLLGKLPILVRYILLNSALFMLYLAGGMLLVYLNIRAYANGMYFGGYPLGTVGVVYHWSSLPVTVYANWRITMISNPRKRAIVGSCVGLLAVAIGFVPYDTVVFWFNVELGGPI